MPSLDESIDLFVGSSEVEGYRKDILIFKDFIESKGVNEYTWKNYLSGINTNAVLDSIDYYIAQNKVTSISTVKRYVSAIKEYFIFMFEHNYLHKNVFFHELSYKFYNDLSYAFQVNKCISQNQILKDTESVTVYGDQEVIEIIQMCDEILSLDVEIVLSLPKNYIKFISALIFKLVLITGTMYRDVIKIDSDALKLRYTSITINGYSIQLPRNLIDQFHKYNEIRSHLPITHTKNLFLQFDGKGLREQTSSIMTHFTGWTGRTDYNGLVKYAVVNMLGEGMGETIIRKFTGAGDTVIKSCWNYVQENQMNRYVDSKIRNIKTFDIL